MLIARNTFFGSSTNTFSLFPHKEKVKQSFLSPILQTSSVIQKLVPKAWRVLCLFTDKIRLMLIKIMKCFYSIIKKDKEANLEELFGHSINYENFRDNILSEESENLLVYNNYTFISYSTLIKFDYEILKSHQTTREKNLNAGIAVYNLIVELYVQRFLARHPQMNDKHFLPSLHFIALGIAIKQSIDKRIANSEFRDFLPQKSLLSPKTHASMEREFLKVIKWNTSISELHSQPDLL